MAKADRLQKRVQQAAVSLRSGDVTLAVVLLQEVLQSDRKNVDALSMLGMIRARQGSYPEAAALLGDALKRSPRDADVHNNLGLVMQALGRHDEAIVSFETAIRIDSRQPLARYNLACTLQLLNLHHKAVRSFDLALELAPGDADAFNNRGNSLQALNRYVEAIASYDRALELRPVFAEALSNRGNALQATKRNQEAIDSYRRAIGIKADYADARFNLGVAQLRLGDFDAGWRGYEWRWARDDHAGQKRDFPQPQWSGEEEIAGKTILLHAEQGLGDTIQFARFATMVAKRGARVVLEVQPALKSLMSGITGVDAVVARGDTLPEFDMQCPLLSLPFALNLKPEHFSADKAYLAAPSGMTSIVKDKWQSLVGAEPGRRVGIAWSGNRENVNDFNRSIALENLLPLLATADTRWFSLQKDLRTGDAELLARHPEIVDCRNELVNFADAGMVEHLDLVITVDTVVAHLAGAMGKPVWILLPFCADWRWLENRDDSPWYPGARLFRQTAIGDWGGVIKRVQDQLAQPWIPATQN